MRYKARFCPQCKSHLVRRSHRYGFFESVILPLLALRPYRCEGCYFRYAGSIFRSRRVSYFLSQVRLPRVIGLASLAILAWVNSMWPELTVAAARQVVATSAKLGAIVSARSAPVTTAPYSFTAPVHVQRGEMHFDVASLSSPVNRVSELPQLARKPIGALQVTGQAYIGDQPVAGEATVFAGDSVRLAAGATATLRLPEEGILAIGSDTQIDFPDSAQFAADLQRGTVGFRIFGPVKRSRIRVGRYVLVPVPNQNTVGAITRTAQGRAHFVCSEGSFGIVALESSEAVFLVAGEEADLASDGRLVKRSAQQAQAPTPAPAPPVAGGGGGGRKAAVILGVAGGAGAVAALALGKGNDSVSPAAP